MGGCNDVGHTLRSSGLLQLEACRARIFMSSPKTGGGAMEGGARGTITKDASRSSQRQMGQCDVLRRTLLPLLYSFLVFYMGL
jgi:hypothetical protein